MASQGQGTVEGQLRGRIFDDLDARGADNTGIGHHGGAIMPSIARLSRHCGISGDGTWATPFEISFDRQSGRTAEERKGT